jgi:hypothetical protein
MCDELHFNPQKASEIHEGNWYILKNNNQDSKNDT